jgi:hypothetical protein
LGLDESEYVEKAIANDDAADAGVKVKL